MVLVLLRRRSTLGVGVTVVFQRHDRELVELYLDSVTYEALSIYNVLANRMFARTNTKATTNCDRRDTSQTRNREPRDFWW